MTTDNAKQRPSHRLILQHDEEGKSQTEVGALWPHKQGGGFSVTLKRGIALLSLNGSRIHAFPVKDDQKTGGTHGERD